MRFDRSQECLGCCGCLSAGRVTVAAPPAPLKAALLLYAVPLTLLLTGFAAGSALASDFGIASAAPAISTAVGAAVGVLLFFGAFGVLRLAFRRCSG